MSKRSELINKVRAILQPSQITMYRVDSGPIRYNGMTVSEAQLKVYQARHEVRIFNIVPASRRFKAI